MKANAIAIVGLSVACGLLLALNLMTSDFLSDSVSGFVSGHRTCPYKAIAYEELYKQQSIIEQHLPSFDLDAPLTQAEHFASVNVYYAPRTGWTSDGPEVSIQRLTCKVLRVKTGRK